METINLNSFVSTNFDNLYEFEEKATVGSCQTFGDDIYYKVFINDDAETQTVDELKDNFIIE